MFHAILTAARRGELLSPACRASLRVVALVVVFCFRAGPAAAQPFVEFLGQTFYIARGEMDGSMGVAFDPFARKVLSVGLTDPCGADLESPFADQGAAWDPIEGRFWTINEQREVMTWDGDTQVPRFTIPEFFDVPGVGPDTLESVRGLALDEEYLYLVDAGPNFGEIESNAWFKFTRDGAPVSSSKATDFTANLDAAPDATVDGICWIPPDAPYGAGLFLVALEHSGFQIIDDDGFFVDEFIWEEEEIPIGAVPFAFSGITMDPLTGDLYLVENSGSQMYVWVRLPPEDTPVVYSIGVPQLRIHHPTDGCRRETFYGTGDPGDIFFSLAFRPSDGMFWTSHFNTGELYFLDPRSGLKSSTGVVGPRGIWGMAYDEANDRLYLHASDDQQIWTYDFASADLTETSSTVGFYTRDIALRSIDGMIYSVENGGAHNLVRIDPETGAGTAIAPTGSVIGIDYDESTDRLLGIEASTMSLIAIDPETGSSVVLEDLSGTPFSSEALGIIPHRADDTSSVDGGPVSADGEPDGFSLPKHHPRPLLLRVFPTPTHGTVEIHWPAQDPSGAGNGHRAPWKAPTDTGVRVEILDAVGRTVRTLVRDGGGSVRWDGSDDEGHSVPSGVYFVRGRGSQPATGRIVIQR